MKAATGQETNYAETARRMRAEFDKSFALSAPTGTHDTEGLLAIRIGGDGYALRVGEITGLSAGRKIIPLPGAPPALLGLSGFRGGLTPVWDLAALLEYAGTRQTPRWFIHGPGEAPWALACYALDGYFSVPKSQLIRHTPLHNPANAAAEFTAEACPVGGVMRTVLDLGRMRAAVKKISSSHKTGRV